MNFSLDVREKASIYRTIKVLITSINTYNSNPTNKTPIINYINDLAMKFRNISTMMFKKNPPSKQYINSITGLKDFFNEMVETINNFPKINNQNDILDDPDFINAITNFFRELWFMFTFRILNPMELVNNLINAVNNFTRPDYVVMKCKIFKENEKEGLEQLELAKNVYNNANIDWVNNYLCSRAIISIFDAKKNTRIVISNTVGIDNDDQDYKYVESIMPTLSGGLIDYKSKYYKYKNKYNNLKKRAN